MPTIYLFNYWDKEYRSCYQGPSYIKVHEVVVLILGGFLETFSEQSLLNGSIKRLATEIITKGERCQEFSITNNSPKHAQVK